MVMRGAVTHVAMCSKASGQLQEREYSSIELFLPCAAPFMEATTLERHSIKELGPCKEDRKQHSLENERTSCFSS